MRLRIKPTDSAIIQKLDCDGNWQDWYTYADGLVDSVNQVGAAARQGQGQIVEPNAPNSGSGACVEYDVVMLANQQYLLPVTIDAGDTIQITDATGATQDGVSFLGIANWYWPSGDSYRGLPGNQFDAGSGTVLGSPDPLVVSNHMRLIINVGGVWYDAFDTTITVATGISQGNVVFMTNDSNISDNVGQYKFHIRICKSGGFWSHLLTPANWSGIVTVSPELTSLGGPTATLDGSGAHGTNDNGNGSSYEAHLKIILPVSGNVTKVKPTFHSVKTRNNGAQDQIFIADTNGTGTVRDAYNISSVVGSYSGSPELNHAWSGITSFGLVGFARNAVVGDGAEFTFTQILLFGDGPNPFA